MSRSAEGGRQERSPQIRSFGIGSEPTRSELSWRRATRICARLAALSSNAKSEREPLHVTPGPRSTCAQSHTARCPRGGDPPQRD